MIRPQQTKVTTPIVKERAVLGIGTVDCDTPSQRISQPFATFKQARDLVETIHINTLPNDILNKATASTYSDWPGSKDCQDMRVIHISNVRR